MSSTTTSGNTTVESTTTSGNATVDSTSVSGNATVKSSSTTSNDTTVSNIYTNIFTRSNVIILLWFLAIYFVIYFLLNIFYSSEQNKLKTASNIFDLLILILVLFLLGYNFFNLSSQEKQNALQDLGVSMGDYISEPTSIFSSILFIVALYLLVFIVGIPMSYDTKPRTIQILEGGAWIMLTMVLIENFFKFVLGVSFVQLLSDLFNRLWGNMPADETEKIDVNGIVVVSGNAVVGGNADVSGTKEEVFNVGNNLYTYDDAQAVCKAYGARLATYDDIEKSYTEGGEWCNYGWSANQMAFFPTQKSTWQQLQQDSSTKNACGRPGINGGYFANPNIKFGVNCYGVKPSPKKMDLAYMDAAAANKNKVPSNKYQSMIDKKAEFYRENADHVLRVNAFNGKQWSEY